MWHIKLRIDRQRKEEEEEEDDDETKGEGREKKCFKRQASKQHHLGTHLNILRTNDEINL